MQISRMMRYLVLAILMLAISASSFAGVFVSVTVAPPVLPVYVQPACPGDGYIWTPGYWAYGPDGYFWVPGLLSQVSFGRLVIGVGAEACTFGMPDTGVHTSVSTVA